MEKHRAVVENIFWYILVHVISLTLHLSDLIKLVIETKTFYLLLLNRPENTLSRSPSCLGHVGDCHPPRQGEHSAVRRTFQPRYLSGRSQAEVGGS